MSHLKSTLDYVSELVSLYAVYNRYHQKYILNIYDELPDFCRHKLVSILISEDEDLATEANGPDNPAYEKVMLPALYQHLKDSTDRDTEIEFTQKWREGVSHYFGKTMQELVDEACTARLQDEFRYAGLHQHVRKENGEIYWSRY